MPSEKLHFTVTGAFLAASISLANLASAQTPSERAAYLVNAVMACDGCHTPRGPNGAFDMSKRFSGGSNIFDEPNYLVKGANITPDKETGVGAWSDAELKRALTQGVRPNGTQIATSMPYTFYRGLTQGDLDAIVAYVRAVPAVSNKVQAPVYKGPMKPVPIPGAESPMAEGDLANPVKRGFYLATAAHCMECHAGYVDHSPDYKTSLGKGGRIFSGPYGSVAAVNITSSKTNGIGDWTDEEIKQVLVTGRGRNGRQLVPPMARNFYFSKMVPDDLSAIVAYLRTLPPID